MTGDPAVNEPKIIETRSEFEGKLIRVRVDRVRMGGGATFEREVVEYGQAVVLVPVDPDGRLLLVRQYRHAVGQWLLELPAGGIDPSDVSPEAAAQRELREETGYSGTLRRLGGLFLAPGYSDEYQHIFAATNLREAALAADEDEDLTLERMTLGDVLAAVDAAEIRDAKSMAALLMYTRSISSDRS